MRATRKRFSDAERQAILKRWRASGLSGMRFAAREGLSKSVLYGWAKREAALQKGAAEMSRPSGAAFEELCVASTAVPALEPVGSGGSYLEVVARCGRLIRVQGQVSVSALRSTLQALEAC